jgi:hypothetical protein
LRAGQGRKALAARLAMLVFKQSVFIFPCLAYCADFLKKGLEK